MNMCERFGFWQMVIPACFRKHLDRALIYLLVMVMTGTTVLKVQGADLLAIVSQWESIAQPCVLLTGKQQGVIGGRQPLSDSTLAWNSEFKLLCGPSAFRVDHFEAGLMPNGFEALRETLIYRSHFVCDGSFCDKHEVPRNYVLNRATPPKLLHKTLDLIFGGIGRGFLKQELAAAVVEQRDGELIVRLPDPGKESQELVLFLSTANDLLTRSESIYEGKVLESVELAYSEASRNILGLNRAKYGQFSDGVLVDEVVVTIENIEIISKDFESRFKLDTPGPSVFIVDGAKKPESMYDEGDGPIGTQLAGKPTNRGWIPYVAIVGICFLVISGAIALRRR